MENALRVKRQEVQLYRYRELSYPLSWTTFDSGVAQAYISLTTYGPISPFPVVHILKVHLISHSIVVYGAI